MTRKYIDIRRDADGGITTSRDGIMSPEHLILLEADRDRRIEALVNAVIYARDNGWTRANIDRVESCLDER